MPRWLLRLLGTVEWDNNSNRPQFVDVRLAGCGDGEWMGLSNIQQIANVNSSTIASDGWAWMAATLKAERKQSALLQYDLSRSL